MFEYGGKSDDRTEHIVTSKRRTSDNEETKKETLALGSELAAITTDKEKVGDVHYAYSRLDREREEGLILRAIARSVMTGWKRDKYGA